MLIHRFGTLASGLVTARLWLWQVGGKAVSCAIAKSDAWHRLAQHKWLDPVTANHEVLEYPLQHIIVVSRF